MPSSSNHFSLNSSSFIPILSQKEVSKASRYGFNRQEKDNEISGVGDGNDYTATNWQYDPRLGRRWNIDIEFKTRPFNSPFIAFSNNPIIKIDPKGDDDYFFNRQGVIIDHVPNKNPDQFFITSETRKVNRDASNNNIPTPKIDFQISPNSNLGALARTVYAEMGGGTLIDKRIAAESIYNRMKTNDKYSKGGTIREIVEKKGYRSSDNTFHYQYDIANPANGRNSVYENPQATYGNNKSERLAFEQSMAAAIKTIYENPIGGGVTSYHSSDPNFRDNNSNYVKLNLPEGASGIKGMWKFKVDEPKKEVEIKDKPIESDRKCTKY